MNLKRTYFILLAGLLVFSCQNKNAKEEASVENAVEEIQSDRATVLPQMKSPAEFAALLQSTGAEFNPLFLSDPNKASGYLATPEKAVVMLGAYMFDLGYSIAFKERDYVDKYYTASHMLATELGAEKTFLALLMNRYKENIEANDSLKLYFEETYKHATENVREGDVASGYYRTLFLAGFYVEGLFALLEMIEDYPKDMLPDDARMTILMPVIKTVLNQEPNIRNIYGMLKENVLSDDNRDQEIYMAFTDLIATYDNLNIQSKIDSNQGGDLLSDETFLDLIRKVDVIRAKMVN